MIGGSHLQLCRKNSYSSKLQNGAIDHSSSKISVEDFFFNKYVAFLFSKLHGKLTPIFQRNINAFCYILPNSCFTKQPQIPASEYMCDKNFFAACLTK